MKIAVSDNNNRKFIQGLIDRWQQNDHEVKFELGTNPALFQWADVYFIDSCDHNAQVASQAKKFNCKLYIRVLDIEAWVNHPAGVKWENVDGVIFINRRIKELVESYANLKTQIAIIPCGVDLNKFNLKKQMAGKKIVQVVGKGRIYNDKRVDDAVRILHQLRKIDSQYTLSVVGTDSTQNYYLAYLKELVKESGLSESVEFINYIPDLNEWLEDKDYMITPGIKEAFSFATAEVMAKGIKPVINHFWGAHELWPTEYIYYDFEEAVNMLLAKPEPEKYREYIQNKYNLERFYKEMNDFMGIK